MTVPTAIWPDRHQRLAEQSRLSVQLADALEAVQKGRVARTPTPAALQAALSRFDFKTPLAAGDVDDAVIALLLDGMVHVMHPGYFGLFNPSVAFPALLADQITASFNPQMAAWSHAAAANEIESHTLKAFAGRFGWPSTTACGHFTSGGSEANLTALVCALTDAFPRYGDSGAQAIGGSPRFYVSAESHLAWLKIAHQCGIGRDAVRLVATDGSGQMDDGTRPAIRTHTRPSGRVASSA